MSQIDSLEIKLTSNIDNAVDGITKIQQALSSLQSAISSGLDLSPIATGIRDIAESTNSLNIENLSALTESLSALNGMSGFAEIVNSTKNFTKSNKELKTSAEKVTDAIQEQSKVTGDLADRTNEAEKFLNKMKQSNEDLSTTLGTVSGVYSAVFNAYKGIKNAFADVVKVSSNATEAMNRVNVSLGENAHQAYQYAQIVSNATGIYLEEWLDYQARFNTLLTGYGISVDTAYQMSQQLTQLGYDLSSYWDIDIETAFQKLTSTMSGQLQTSKQWGYALEEATLQELAASKGITKRIDSMTMAEKTMLRYYAIMTQSTEAQHDFARTLDSVNNQIKILGSNIMTMAKTIGDILAPIISTILPYLIAIVRVITSIFTVLGGIAGIKFKEPDWSSTSKGVSNVSKSLDTATKSAKEYKRQLLGIDELNVLTAPTSSGTSGNGGLGGDIESALDIGSLGYDFLEGINQNGINKIVNGMKEWLGLNKEINSLTDLLSTRFGEILITVGLIGAGLLLWKVSTTVTAAVAGLTTLFESGAGSSFFTKMAGWGLLFTGFVMAITNGIDVISAALITFGAMIIGFTVGGPVGIAIGLVVGLVTSLVIALIQKKDETLEMLANAWNWVTGLIDTILSGVAYAIGWILAKMVELGEGVINTLVDFFNNGDLIEIGANIVKGLWKGITGLLSWLWERIKGFGQKIIDAFCETLGIHSPSTVFAGFGKNIVQGLINGIGNMFGAVKNKIVSLASNVTNWFKDKLGIHSPSRVFSKLGGFTVEGYNQGFEKMSGETQNMVQSWADDIANVSPTIGVGVASDLSNLYKGENITSSVNGTLEMNMQDLGMTLEDFYHNFLEEPLTQIANDIHEQAINGGNSNVRVSVTLDGKEVGKSVVDYHNDVVKRTGRSPLVI